MVRVRKLADPFPGLALALVGEECAKGEPGLGELMEHVLLNELLLVDVLESLLIKVELKRLVEKLGIPHLQHSHGRSVLVRVLKTSSDMLAQSLWNHVSQDSHKTLAFAPL